MRKARLGQYARQTCRFYEWLTGHQLDVPDADARRVESVRAGDQGSRIFGSRGSTRIRLRLYPSDGGGNGRIHRFLINDTLVGDTAVPDGVILPVSTTNTISAELRAGYDRTLEMFSHPFMRRYAASYRFGEIVTYEDGTLGNFIFNDYQSA